MSSASGLSKTIFWHESSADEPSATPRADRARGTGSAGIAAMPVAGGVARLDLPPAGRGQRGGAHNHGADRSAVSGPALLRFAPDGGVAGHPSPCRQPQTRTASDAAHGAGGDLPATEHEQGRRGSQSLPISARRHHDRAGQPSLVLGRDLYPDGQRFPLPGGHYGLGEPRGAGVAAVQHARRRVLCRGARGSAGALWPAEIFNTDQGSQFTSDEFTGTLKRHGVMISMDGKGRCMDNIFVERLWRSLKYEEVYLKAYATVAEAKTGIGAWLGFYNEERQHQSLGYRTPRRIYQEGLWICGRSALPTGCASPASRASSVGGEMLAFAHIPTGAAANKEFDIDEVNSRLVDPAVALTTIGADIETGGATP